MFQNFPNFPNFQIFKFKNFKKYSELRGATSISDAFFLSGRIASQNETMEYGWHYMSHCIDGEWVPKYIAAIRIVAEYIGNCGGIYWCNSPNVCLSAAPSLWDTVAKCILAFSKWFYICFATSFKCCYHIHNILQFILTLHT